MILMELNDTIKESARTWSHPKDPKYSTADVDLLYISNAIGGEVGELQNKVKKYIRNKYWTKSHSTGSEYDTMKEEVSDIIFYLSRFAALVNMDMEKEFSKKMEENVKRFGLSKA